MAPFELDPLSGDVHEIEIGRVESVDDIVKGLERQVMDER